MGNYPDLVKTLMVLNDKDEVIVVRRSLVQFTGSLEML